MKLLSQFNFGVKLFHEPLTRYFHPAQRRRNSVTNFVHQSKILPYQLRLICTTMELTG